MPFVKYTPLVAAYDDGTQHLVAIEHRYSEPALIDFRTPCGQDLDAEPMLFLGQTVKAQGPLFVDDHLEQPRVKLVLLFWVVHSFVHVDLDAYDVGRLVVKCDQIEVGRRDTSDLLVKGLQELILV